MKYFLIILSCFVIENTACKKHSECTQCEIVKLSSGCQIWSINVNGKIYPSSNIPAEYQQTGLVVCVTYSLYEDYKMCPCCGGTWANIKSIRKVGP